MQPDFTRALLDPELPPPAALSHTLNKLPKKRFGVYRNNVVTSLIEALASAFPTVEKLVGTEFFHAMAGVFVRAHPPTSPLMATYGAGFAEFLADFGPAKSLPYLADVARLDQARRQAYHAADATPGGPEIFAGLDEPALMALRLTLHPSLRLVRSSYPLLAIWKAAHGGDKALPRESQDVLVLRPEWEVVLYALPSGAADFFDALARGDTLGQAAERDATFDLSATLTLALQAGAFQR